MSDPIAATCRSGCALCEQIKLRLGGEAGATSFKLLLETPGGTRSQYVITGWPEQNGVWPADVKPIKFDRPAPTPRPFPDIAQAPNGESTPGTSALRPIMPTALAI